MNIPRDKHRLVLQFSKVGSRVVDPMRINCQGDFLLLQYLLHCVYPHPGVVKSILNESDSVNQHMDGVYPIYIASIKSCSFNIFQMLIEHGADVEKITPNLRQVSDGYFAPQGFNLRSLPCIFTKIEGYVCQTSLEAKKDLFLREISPCALTS